MRVIEQETTLCPPMRGLNQVMMQYCMREQSCYLEDITQRLVIRFGFASLYRCSVNNGRSRTPCLGGSINFVGRGSQDSGRIEEALERYREALVISEANDLRMQIGELLARLGGVAPIDNEEWNTFREHYRFQRIRCSD